MPGSLLGNAVQRVEDPELLVGSGRYVDDVDVADALHLVFVRSPYAHARIRSIDTSEAASMPGVVAVYTHDDIGLVAPTFIVVNPHVERPVLAAGKVRFVGDPVAAVVAESVAQAQDAAAAVVVDYDPLPAVADVEAAMEPGAPQQFEEIGSNIAGGFRDGAPDPLDGADVVVRGRFVNQRVAVVPMEPNVVASLPGDTLTVYVATQMPHGAANHIAKTFDLERDSVRVIAPYVGGGFGAKAGASPEHIVTIAASRALGRPVRWAETRSENMIAMPHGRAQVQYAEMGFRRDGTITGLRCRVIADTGAYAYFNGALAMGPTRMMAQGVYRVPAIAYDAAAVLTNTTPVGAFRGAGRPEAAAMLERLMDLAADELDIDPVEIRRRNLLSADQFPYATRTGVTYDSGDYRAALDEAVRLAGYDELRAEQARRRAAGDPRLLGIGVAVYVEITAGGGSSEFGAVEVNEDGTATVRAGTSAHGQGHATSFAMIVSDKLGIPLEAIRFVQSDTALVPRGGGTGGSRSLQMGGSAVLAASESVLGQGRALAASLLEADPADIVLADGGLGVAGVPTSSLSWAELARTGRQRDEPLIAEEDVTQSGPSFPFGAHVAVVEVDSETGRVSLLRHVAVDDCGRVLNPLIVAGQQHGGIAQGAAQALYESFVYDDDGNPLTSTLAEYAMPAASELPSFETANTETPSPLNPLGAKGIGESGTIGSTPAVQNAVVDALSHLGVRHLDMPATPERVWRAIEDARRGTLPPVWREPPAAFAGLPVRPGSAPASEAEEEATGI
ncbi:MAG TPA: xanthine dehydrogenase family protein molybdopterin-binding subunit [Acidimicrobiales bacterium]|nr:xanthine dehydrogenase family protein molybdopterin-binding subunit [Acidimicrobiales bacterium]